MADYIHTQTSLTCLETSEEKTDGGNPIVFIKGDKIFANSRDVATYFGKRHDHIIRDIEKLIAEGVPKFGETVTERPNPSGGALLKSKSYDMDRDGFTLLAMGFTGKKALQFKLRYIAQFNAMETALKKQLQPTIDYSDPAVLLGVVSHLQIESQKQKRQLEEQGQRLKTLDRLEGAKGSMCVTDAAKTLNKRPKEIFDFMHSRRWIYKRPGNKNWIAYDDKLKTGYLEHDEHLYMDNLGQERVSTRVLVTAKGMVKLADLLGQPLI